MNVVKSKLESTLIKIFLEVLNIDNIKKESNFIELGGDSLKSMKVISKIKETVKIELSFKEFFLCPNIQCVINQVYEKLISKKDKNLV